MTDEQYERDEAELRQLFEESAEKPSHADIARLARFAANIPGRRVAPRLGWLPSFRVQRGLAVAGAALAVVAFVFVRAIDVSDVPGEKGETAENTPRPGEAVTEPGTLEVVGLGDEADLDDPFPDLGDGLLAALSAESFADDDDDLVEDSLGGLDMMAGPADGMDAAAWMEAYDRALEDG